jgi:hypothetical protein
MLYDANKAQEMAAKMLVKLLNENHMTHI